MRDTRSLASRSLPALGAALTLAIGVSSCNCGKQNQVVHTIQEATFVPGSPTVEPENPSVQVGVQPPPIEYGVNVPEQCDTFTQSEIRQIDILFMVDSSGSMAARQAELKANFKTFINYLLTSQPPIDFHIAVITADADDPNESGRLHSWSEPLSATSGNYIACDANQICNTVSAGNGVCGVAGNACPNGDGDCCSGYTCNANGACDPSNASIDAFTQISNVGTKGSPVERGLYTSYLALVNPANQDQTATGGAPGFIRPSAGLYIVMVSDEDDSSCTPQVGEPTGPNDNCRNDPGCRCDDNPIFGTTDYWANFFKTYKGFGKGNLVTVGAIVGANTESVPSQFGDLQYFPGTQTFTHMGCNTSPPQPYAAYWGKRYTEVVAKTGGTVISICNNDFANALSQLGFAITGLRSIFHLSRGPEQGSLTAFEAPAPNDVCYLTCQSDADCTNNFNSSCTAVAVSGGPLYTACQSGRCTNPISISQQPTTTTAQYVECQNQVVLNSVEFGGGVIPPAEGSVEICYAVNPDFSDNVCQ